MYFVMTKKHNEERTLIRTCETYEQLVELFKTIGKEYKISEAECIIANNGEPLSEWPMDIKLYKGSRVFFKLEEVLQIKPAELEREMRELVELKRGVATVYFMMTKEYNEERTLIRTCKTVRELTELFKTIGKEYRISEAEYIIAHNGESPLEPPIDIKLYKGPRVFFNFEEQLQIKPANVQREMWELWELTP